MSLLILALSEQSLAKAVSHVDDMQADMGGTNILSPLLEVLRKPVKPGVPRQLFVLTGACKKGLRVCVCVFCSFPLSAHIVSLCCACMRML